MDLDQDEISSVTVSTSSNDSCSDESDTDDGEKTPTQKKPEKLDKQQAQELKRLIHSVIENDVNPLQHLALCALNSTSISREKLKMNTESRTIDELHKKLVIALSHEQQKLIPDGEEPGKISTAAESVAETIISTIQNTIKLRAEVRKKHPNVRQAIDFDTVVTGAALLPGPDVQPTVLMNAKRRLLKLYSNPDHSID